MVIKVPLTLALAIKWCYKNRFDEDDGSDDDDDRLLMLGVVKPITSKFVCR